LLALDEPSLAEHAKVVADRSLRQVERLHQVANARLAAGLRLDEAEDPKPGGVGESFQRRCKVLGVLGREGLGEKRRAGGSDDGDGLHRAILTHINDVAIIKALIAVDVSEVRPMPEILDPVTQHHVDQAAARLADEFKGVFSEETIARYIADSLDLLDNSRINVFVPVLAHRFARERLRALAQVEGKLTTEEPEVLFVCIHNAGRSQMAAGLVKLRSEGRIHVRSAGSDPADQINPAVVEAMAELGVDMREEFP
jgi:hypothetical protein